MSNLEELLNIPTRPKHISKLAALDERLSKFFTLFKTLLEKLMPFPFSFFFLSSKTTPKQVFHLYLKMIHHFVSFIGIPLCFICVLFSWIVYALSLVVFFVFNFILSTKKQNLKNIFEASAIMGMALTGLIFILILFNFILDGDHYPEKVKAQISIVVFLSSVMMSIPLFSYVAYVENGNYPLKFEYDNKFNLLAILSFLIPGAHVAYAKQSPPKVQNNIKKHNGLINYLTKKKDKIKTYFLQQVD